MMPWGRVGSNLLFGQIKQVAVWRKARYDNENFITLKEAEQQFEWARRFYGDVDGIDVVGSKQNMLSVRRPDEMRDLLGEIGIRLIRMRRANLVKVAISQLRAEIYAEQSLSQTGAAVWGLRKEQPPLGSAPLKPRRFLNAVARARKADDLLSAFAPAVETFEIEYRDLQDDLDGVTARVCGWLDLDVGPRIEATYIKGTPDDLAIVVPNLDELRFALRASPLADLDPMFDT